MDNINEERLKHLLVKHLLDDLDEGEREELWKWKAVSGENSNLLERLSDSSYIKKRYQDFMTAVSGREVSSRKVPRRYFWGLATALAAAAVLLVFLLVPGLRGGKMITYTAPQKGIAHLVLPDGSQVWMKSSSTITYPERFSRKSRNVSFAGEGYFEVMENPSAPFMADCDAFKVKVTGTKFDIKSYRDEKQGFAALIDGEVSIIYSDSCGVEREDKMVSGELSVFDKASRQNKIMKANTTIYSSWIGGVYSFESETLESILKEVSRYYGYNLICSDSIVKNKVLSGRLQMGDDVESIITAFREFLPGHIKLESDTIIIQ